jgi:hypothetical protein
MDEDLKALFQTPIEAQIRTGKNVGDLVPTMHSHAEASDARAGRMAEAHTRSGAKGRCLAGEISGGAAAGGSD